MNGTEIILLLVLAAVVVGPERLPQYAEQLARLVRTMRDMARGATQSIKEELGPDGVDLDFSKLDPRQYDPRRIVRDALLDDLSPTSKPAARRTSTASKAAGGAAKAAGTAAAGSSTSDGAEDQPAAEAVDPLASGAPFDAEAT